MFQQGLQHRRHLAVEQPADAFDFQPIACRAESGAGRQAVGGAPPGRTEEQGAFGRDAHLLAIEEIDVGLALDRDLAADPPVGAIVACLDDDVLARFGIGEEDAQSGADLEALDIRAPAFVVYHDVLTDP